jgi:hypothetical protein
MFSIMATLFLRWEDSIRSQLVGSLLSTKEGIAFVINLHPCTCVFSIPVGVLLYCRVSFKISVFSYLLCFSERPSLAPTGTCVFQLIGRPGMVVQYHICTVLYRQQSVLSVGVLLATVCT